MGDVRPDSSAAHEQSTEALEASDIVSRGLLPSNICSLRVGPYRWAPPTGTGLDYQVASFENDLAARFATRGGWDGGPQALFIRSTIAYPDKKVESKLAWDFGFLPATTTTGFFNDYAGTGVDAAVVGYCLVDGTPVGSPFDPKTSKRYPTLKDAIVVYDPRVPCPACNAFVSPG